MQYLCFVSVSGYRETRRVGKRTKEGDAETGDVDGREFVVEDGGGEEDGGDFFEDAGDRAARVS